jgi:hypothetical protein
MRQQDLNGRRRQSRPSLDPDRRPTHPAAFWPLPPEQALVVCGRCACPVPATDRAQQLHRQWHEQVAGLEDGRAR